VGLDITPNKARQRDVRAAVSNSAGFGGHNVSLAVKRFAE
jgi:3-oxoacyl-[acyl-carrier-protein] synthase II